MAGISPRYLTASSWNLKCCLYLPYGRADPIRDLAQFPGQSESTSFTVFPLKAGADWQNELCPDKKTCEIAVSRDCLPKVAAHIHNFLT